MDWFTRCLEGVKAAKQFYCFGCQKDRKAGSRSWGLDIHKGVVGVVTFCTKRCRENYIKESPGKWV